MNKLAALALTGTVAACSTAELEGFTADPLTVSAPSSPNWVLAAPKEADPTTPATLEAPVFATGPAELLGYLDQIVATEARVERLAPGGADRAFVQRSANVGFPDVISVSALDLGAGDAGARSGLVIFSRSVYGYGDLGVNKARVRRWLAKLEETAPVVAGRGTTGDGS